MHPVRQQRIVDFAHAHPGALLDAFDRGFRGQSAVDRFVDPAAPPLVIGEHLVGLENLHMLAALAEFRLLAHRIDLVAHLVEGAVDPLAFRLDVLRHDLVDLDAGLVEDRDAGREAFHQGKAVENLHFGRRFAKVQVGLVIDQFLVGDKLRQDHGGGLQGLDLDVLVLARIHVLDAQHADRTLTVDDGDAGEGMEFFLPGFRTIEEVRVRLGLCKVQRFDVLGDRARQPFADAHAGDVDRFGVEAASGVEFQRPFAQEVDRAHFARQRIGDDFDHAIQLVLGVRAPGHNFVKARENLASGCNC